MQSALRTTILLTVMPVVSACSKPARQSERALDGRDRWRLVADADSVVEMLDTRTIERIDTSAYRIWIKWEWKRPRDSTAKSDERSFRTALSREELDCARRVLRQREGTYYDSRGNAVGEMPSTRWKSILPESNGEVLLDTACAYLRATVLPIKQGEP